jgi:hypothetical protein
LEQALCTHITSSFLARKIEDYKKMAMHLLASLYKLKDSQAMLTIEIEVGIVYHSQLELEFWLVNGSKGLSLK